jgi:sigma-E factor negative regulatory protein RseB
MKQRLITAQVKNRQNENLGRGKLAMRLSVLFLGVLLAVVENVSAEDRSASLDWLEVAAFAGHQTNYSGIFVYQYENHVETSNIIHVSEADSEFEKLESLDGPKREIIRHDGLVWSYTNHKMVQMDSQQGRGRFPFLLPEQLSALNSNYQAKQLGVERVAGYDAQVILFQPKDNLRYTHKMWVHTDSGLLLKAAVLTEKNHVAEQYAFTQLQIGGPIDRSWITLSASAGLQGKGLLHHPITVKNGEPSNSGWVADLLPTGFNKTMEIQRTMRGKHGPVTQIVYSDGLSAISVFIEANDGDEDDVDGLYSRGALNIYHKVLDKNLITVVGEVPPRTVMKVLDSVRYNGK